jgi:hypothetical protein
VYGFVETNSPLFKEEQRFRQAPLWAGVASVALFEWLRFARRSIARRTSIWAWIRWVALGVAIPWAVYSAKLITEVKENQLRVEFTSSLLQVAHLMSLDELKSHEVVTYRPFKDFGGWGLRWTPWSGWAYNVSGNEGVKVELENGTQLLIGSQRAPELDEAIRSAARSS